MKRFLPALLLLVASTAGAQTSVSSIGVTATVQSAVSFSGMSALAFGAGIIPGTLTTIAPADGGKLTVSYNVDTQVSMPNSVTLTRVGGGSVPVSLTCAQASSAASTTPSLFATDCATGYSAALVSGARTSWYLYLGGSIAAAATSTVPAGDYTGSVTVTATFTSF